MVGQTNLERMPVPKVMQLARREKIYVAAGLARTQTALQCRGMDRKAQKRLEQQSEVSLSENVWAATVLVEAGQSENMWTAIVLVEAGKILRMILAVTVWQMKPWTKPGVRHSGQIIAPRLSSLLR